MELAEINFLEILEASAKSPLGIIALVILSMSIVGVIMFRKSEDKYKFGVFVILLLGVVTFTYASLQTLQPLLPPEPDSTYECIPSYSEKVDVEKTEHDDHVSKDNSLKKDMASIKKPSSTEKLILEGINKEGFIYLGTFRSGSWSDPRFIGAAGELMPNDVITLTDSRKMFECAPYRKTIFSLNFTYCNDVIGSVERGGKVQVLKTPVSVGLNRIWAYVREVE